MLKCLKNKTNEKGMFPLAKKKNYYKYNAFLHSYSIIFDPFGDQYLKREREYKVYCMYMVEDNVHQ